MSFEFDPLENIDRSEDDNDPKTLKALEVREDSWKSPRWTQVGTANRSQGHAHDGPGQDQGRPLGDQGLP